MNPGALFCSAKLARLAAAEASWELRFWLWRLANLWAALLEDCDLSLDEGVRRVVRWKLEGLRERNMLGNGSVV